MQFTLKFLPKNEKPNALLANPSDMGGGGPLPPGPPCGRPHGHRKETPDFQGVLILASVLLVLYREALVV